MDVFILIFYVYGIEKNRYFSFIFIFFIFCVGDKGFIGGYLAGE